MSMCTCMWLKKTTCTAKPALVITSIKQLQCTCIMQP